MLKSVFRKSTQLTFPRWTVVICTGHVACGLAITVSSLEAPFYAGQKVSSFRA